MKIGERGQVTIPRDLREKLNLHPATEVEFTVKQGELVLRKTPSPLLARDRKIREWIGCLSRQPNDIDKFIEDIRGR